MTDVYVPPFPIGLQLDGTPLQGDDCVAGTDAWVVARSTQGAILPTAAHIRALTGDTSGGLSYDQVKAVDQHYYHLDKEFDPAAPWGDIETKSARSGFGVCVSYKTLAGTEYDCFRGLFKGNHSLYVNRRFADGSWQVGDPGADGRYHGCPDGWQQYPDEVLRKAAAGFVRGDGSKQGASTAYVLFTVPDPLVVVRWAVSIHPAPVTTSRQFWRYFVVNGQITGRRSYRTGGFSAPCTPPVRYPWPALKTTRNLVRITAGGFTGWYVPDIYAKEIS